MALNQPPDDALVTTDQVIERLQVNLRTVYRLIRAGKIPAVRVGRQWRFRQRDIDAWIERQRTPTAGQEPAAVQRRQGPARVLVVDDEPVMRDLLAQTLALADYVVDTAADGGAALARLRASDYDLLIADLRMPDMDGLTLIRQVRHLRAGLPVVIITGFSSESSAVEAVNLGVAGYLRKPFRVPEVLAAASKALGAPAA